MSMQNKLKYRGIFMLIAFFILLAIIFSPVFPGKMNGLVYMDNLFNMISKGSSYFIPKTLEESDKFAEKTIDATITMANDNEAADVAKLFIASDAEVAVSGSELVIKGNVGQIMKTVLQDADLLFNNNGTQLSEKYGYNERQVIYNWWNACSKISKYLIKEKRFEGAKVFENIKKKALEPAYNYYGVEIENWKDNIFMVLASLVFYVCYTLWYGFGLMYCFEGLGYKIGH